MGLIVEGLAGSGGDMVVEGRCQRGVNGEETVACGSCRQYGQWPVEIVGWVIGLLGLLSVNSILESVLVSKDVKSLVDLRSALTEFIRDESLQIFQEISGKSVDYKLLCIDFRIRVFALIGDVQVLFCSIF
ncbi:unnamed protein product [Fraxinus pennsylvanica]|uniref:Uncharacterized protein n=1 Tax=Fraxinus pennsylvanica TaxID=56036 RepID=A0AAD1ZJM4_9LAMI|nr:unnamed protein product [Fraxinus pennsylvanica]